jgi:phosphatidylinositol glycan class U
MHNKFILGTGLVVPTVLLPVMWFLWLYPGSGNANFFYNQTLVYQFFALKVVTEFLAATLRRDKHIQEFWKLNHLREQNNDDE